MGQALYDRWVADGSPFTLARPLRHLRDLLRGYGYVVYDRGNRAHLLHDPPEDHTPYSATGWPNTARYGYGYAIDVMPAGGSGLPSLQQLGRQLYADRAAGDIKWLKYMNWEPEGNYTGPCYHDSWQPDHVRRSSSDRGHIHLSARTGYEESTAGDGYDPVAAIRGEDDMTPADFAKLLDDPAVAAKLAALPWRYTGRGINAPSTLLALSEIVTTSRATAAKLGADLVDEQEIARNVLAGLAAVDLADVATLLRTVFGDRVDELAAALVAPGS